MTIDPNLERDLRLLKLHDEPRLRARVVEACVFRSKLDTDSTAKLDSF